MYTGWINLFIFLLVLLKCGIGKTDEGDDCTLTSGKEGTYMSVSSISEKESREFCEASALICCDGRAKRANKTTTSRPILKEGSPCTKNGTRTAGKCKLLTNCPSGVKDLRGGIYPELCGFRKQESIVCCFDNTIPEESCAFPNHPLHGTYRLGGSDASNYTVDDYVPQFRALSLECEENYNTDPTKPTYSLCVYGLWTPSPSTCFQSCPSLKSSKTTKVTCKYNNVLLENCKNPIEGTIAEIACEPLHEEPGLRYNPNRVCRDGTWDYGIPQCFPKCGQKRPKGRTNIINGVNVEVGEYPWQVGVYSSEKQHICGGSILNVKVLLSAAHCFSDSGGNVQPKENYLIAAGKYYRSYGDSRDENAQYSTIDSIRIPECYRGTITNFECDIAVIILTKSLYISESVQPICVDLIDEFEYEQLTENSNGIVTGWGYTKEGEEPSEVLKELSVPYISYIECFLRVPRVFRKFITYDKICGGYLDNSTAVCGGDSGGPLVFARESNDRYYIRGIVSVSPATSLGRCDSNQYGAYTLVSKHLEFIKNLLTLNRA